MQDSKTGASLEYRREIDGLRAVAVLPVIFFHAGFSLFAGGFVGVDVFFVISGYLITSIILSDLRAGTFTFKNFYERRARRILPALFFVMAACLPFAWVHLAPGDLKGFAQSLTAVCTFSSNFLFWGESGYFDTAAELKPLLHTWSLAVEEQYYLLFPLFMQRTWRLGQHKQTRMLVILVAVSFIIAQVSSIYAPEAAFFLLPPRVWELLVGALTAVYLMNHPAPPIRTPAANQRFSLLGLSMILISVFAYDKTTPFPGVYALLPTLGTALVILFAVPGTWAGRLLGGKIAVGLGLVSYSAYLWHQPLFAFTRHIYQMEPPWQVLLALCALSILLAGFNLKFVETPFRKQRTLSRRKVFVVALCTSFVFISLGQAGDKTKGFSQYRLSGRQLELMATVKARPDGNQCSTKGMFYQKPAEACEFFGSNVTWAVMGDSHTKQLSYVLAERLRPHDIGIKQLSFTGCGPTYGRTDTHSSCASWTTEAVDYLIRNPAITTVVVTYRMTYHLWGKHEETYPDFPNKVSEAERIATWRALVGMLEKLHHAGKRVLFVVQPPETSKSIGDLIFRMPPESRDIIGLSRDWWRKRNEFVQLHLRDIPPGILVIDPTNLFCDDRQCYATQNDKSLYIDEDHISLNGAGLIVDSILTAIGPAVR